MIDHALVLAAGLGTRLRPLSDVRAKAAIPVDGEPIVRRIVARLASCGVSDVVVNLHHLPETVTRVLGDGSDLGVRARYSWEPTILGSAGGPALAQPILGVDRFFVVNGDTLTDVDLAAMSQAHAHSSALVTLALVPNREFDRYGGVVVDGSGVVTGFVARGPASRGSFHFIGVQVVDAEALAAVHRGDVARSIGGIYDQLLAARPGSVRGFVSDAAFFDIGTVADYWRTSWALTRSADGSTSGRGARIDASAHVSRSILWNDVSVGARAVAEDCILTDGVRVAAGAVHRREVLVRRMDSDAPASFPLEV
jgi:NDP-sugar pyrophosphorylase family protein